MIRFTVHGIPAPKGSMAGLVDKRTGRVVVKHDNKRTKPWTNAIAWAAKLANDSREPLEGPIVVFAVFYMPRPKSVPKGRTEPAVKPDVDKLKRTTLDALKLARVYVDDGQVVIIAARKAYAGGSADSLGAAGEPRAWIAVGPFRPHHVALMERMQAIAEDGE